ncbi:MAG TPA: acylphosphatase [Candidatus Saccharimonadales bacterium]|nr:acylphosphatase [Candidatus Saccharimonadales bacterium]
MSADPADPADPSASADPARRAPSQRLSATVSGRVQGVGYRWWVRGIADQLGLTGWVMNDPNERTVELLAEGRPEALDELERLLRIGPSGARVERVEVRRGAASGTLGRFQITRP